MRKYLLSGLCGLSFSLIVSCGSAGSGGTTRSAPSYGAITSSSTISNLNLITLQQFAIGYGVCYDIVNNIANPACLANISYTNNPANSSLFGNNFSAQSFVISNATNASVSGVTAYKLEYTSPEQSMLFAGNATPTSTMSGLVLLPNVTSPQKIRGIVLYYHGTTLAQGDVPSASNKYGQFMQPFLASLYAAAGYVVVAPDYPGQGVDTSYAHPYVVFPKPNVLSGLNLITATRTFLASHNIPTSQNLDLYVTGYSEGALYGMWASRYLQGEYSNILASDNLTLARTILSSGPYDLSGATLRAGFSNQYNTENTFRNIYNASPGISLNSSLFSAIYNLNPEYIPIDRVLSNYEMSASKASLITYMMYAYINYNSTPIAYNIAFINRYTAMSNCLNLLAYISGQSSSFCTISNSIPMMFSNSNYDSTTIARQLADAAVGSTYGAGYGNYFTSGKSFTQLAEYIYSGEGPSNNSVAIFIAPFATDPTVMSLLKSVDTYQFVSQSPITLLYLKYDSTVTNVNSQEACSTNGVAGISPSGMVSCKMIDNTSLYNDSLTAGLPEILNHSDSAYMQALVTLGQIPH